MTGIVAHRMLLLRETGATGYDASVLADNPLAYWKCDETTGTTVADSSGNGHDLTAVFSGGNTMATVSEAPRAGFAGMGRALALNLASSTLVRNTAPSAALRLLTGPITFEFLFRRANLGYMWIVFNGVNNGAGGSSSCYFEVRQNSSANGFELKAAGATPSASFVHGITDTNPHLVHLVINSARTSVAYYRDGAFVSNNTLSGWNPSGTSPEGMWLGRRADGNSPGSTWVNNVAIYNAALDASRIAERWARRDIP